MAERYGTIQVRMERGRLVLIGMGKTGRGTAYIKKGVPIESKSPSAPDFKEKLGQAVDELYRSGQ